MFGWKVDYGYYIGTEFHKYPSSMDEIVITDRDRGFFIYQPKTIDIIPEYSTDAQGGYDIIKKSFGSEVDALYSYLIYDKSGGIDSMYSFLPSLRLMCPNLNDAMYESYTSGFPGKFVAIVFRQFNTVIFQASQKGTVPNGSCALYSFNSDGTLVQIAPSSIGIYGHMLGNYSSSNVKYGEAKIPVFKEGVEVNEENLKVKNYFKEYTMYINNQSPQHYGINYSTSLTPNYPYFFTQLFRNGYIAPDATLPLIPENPYEPGGSSTEGGGGGSFNDESDELPIPSIPTLSSSNTGFTRIYNPSLSEVQALASYLWTDESVITTIWNHIKQYFENPMDAIIGFNLIPVPVPNGGRENFKLMYIDTGIDMNTAANQFVDVDCGSLIVDEYYGSALDYSPYTKVDAFLPYIGNVALDVDEVMGRTLSVRYRIDICSGACVCMITVDGVPLYQYSGHCAINIPISSADFSSYVSATVSTAKLAGTLVSGIGSGASAPEGAGAGTAPTPKSYPSVSPSGPQAVPTEDVSASFAETTAKNIGNTVGQIMSAKPHIEHSGSFSGNSGYLGVRRPYLVIKRPNMCMPGNYQKLNGFPSMMTVELSECKGYTTVQQVQLTGLTATNPECDEILGLLKGGVFF